MSRLRPGAKRALPAALVADGGVVLPDVLE
jgi:hypothetical protein